MGILSGGVGCGTLHVLRGTLDLYLHLTPTLPLRRRRSLSARTVVGQFKLLSISLRVYRYMNYDQ